MLRKNNGKYVFIEYTRHCYVLCFYAFLQFTHLPLVFYCCFK